MSAPKNNYLFNFSSSYTGGGLKILKSYLDFFERNGGANFIVNGKLSGQIGEFKHNRVSYVYTSALKRFFDDESYLQPILKSVSKPEIYFSYGIPIYSKVGKVNWFHVSNLIPISPKLSYADVRTMAKLFVLGYRIRRHSKNVDILSADSQDAVDQSMKVLSNRIKITKVLKNGLDAQFADYKVHEKDRSAITIGTQPYKDLSRLYQLYLKLKNQGKVDKLKIVGIEEFIPAELRADPGVVILGVISYDKVIQNLSRSSIYLSTSRIENSSIASLEGLYLCNESYLSTIGSHLEMIKDMNMKYEKTSFDGVGEFYKVSDQVPAEYIQGLSWEKVNTEFYGLLQNVAGGISR